MVQIRSSDKSTCGLLFQSFTSNYLYLISSLSNVSDEFYEWMSQWLFLNVKRAIFQLYRLPVDSCFSELAL
jgi:hypothetical protein